MTCEVCKRHIRGFGYTEYKDIKNFCSLKCQQIHYKKTKHLGEVIMIDPDEQELIALEYSGSMGGEYLDSIEKFDLSKLTQDEYRQFIRCVVGGFTDSLRTQEQSVSQSSNRAVPK